MSTTLDFPHRGGQPFRRVQRSIADDAELARLGIRTEEQAMVFRAIKGNTGIRTEPALARMAGLDDVTATRAAHDLIGLGLVRRGHTAFGVGPFEIIERRR